MSTLNQIEAFIAVVEQGSFTASAIKFNISPTAISKKITCLEKSLNTKLLIRTPRLMKTTDIGQKYYIQCKKILHEFMLSNLIIDSDDNKLSGILNILCVREVAQKNIFPFLGNFLEHYPNIVTDVSIKNNLHNVNLKNFNVAIGYQQEEFFNDWHRRYINGLPLYYQHIEPMELRVQVYIDYFAASYSGS